MTEPLHTEIKQAIVRSLRLPMDPSEIADATPLFGPDGLGLDSVDVLELVLELERSFGVVIADQDTGMQALRSVETIGEFIRARRSQPSA
jgi:acyl carrier protein